MEMSSRVLLVMEAGVTSVVVLTVVCTTQKQQFDSTRGSDLIPLTPLLLVTLVGSVTIAMRWLCRGAEINSIYGARGGGRVCLLETTNKEWNSLRS